MVAVLSFILSVLPVTKIRHFHILKTTPYESLVSHSLFLSIATTESSTASFNVSAFIKHTLWFVQVKNDQNLNRILSGDAL